MLKVDYESWQMDRAKVAVAGRLEKVQGWGLEPRPLQPQQGAQATKATHNNGANCPQEQPPWAVRELQEVDIEQKQH